MEIVGLLALVCLNGVLSMTELAIFAGQRGRLQQRADGGSTAAAAVLRIIENPTPYLSTVQIGITLIGVLAGAFGERALALDLERALEGSGWAAAYAETIATVVVVGAITLASLVLGELVPKRLALLRPEAIACALALPLRTVATLARPVVVVLTALTAAVLWLLRVRETPPEAATEEDVRTVLREAADAGALQSDEHAIARAALALGDLRVGDILVPRHEVEWLDLEESIEEGVERALRAGHTRLIAARGSLDRFVGAVSVSEVVRGRLDGALTDLRTLVRPVEVLPESASVLALLDALRRGVGPLVVAVDEHGQLVGVVTATDLIARLVAGLAPVLGAQQPDMVRREDGSWLVDGDAALRDVEQLPGLEGLAREAHGRVRTLAGFLMAATGHLGRIGECIEWHGARFEIVDMDGLRIDRVLVVPPPASSEAPSD